MGKPRSAERCVERDGKKRCLGKKLPGSDWCRKHAKALIALPLPAVLDAEIDRDGDLRLYQDPLYAERVRSWLGDPKKLLDWRHTMARAQALADMLEDRVRRGGVGGMVPPPLLAAVDQLRQMHLALRRLESNADEVTHIHVSLVDTLMANMMAVLTEFVNPERLGAAIDKLQALQDAARPRRGTFPPRPAATNGAQAAAEPDDDVGMG